LFTGKNPSYKGRPPYASDIYNAILNDSDKPIVLKSDIQLSDEGYSIWKKLYHLGHTISVYDRNKPGSSFIHLPNIEDMDKFINTSIDFKRYQFVLSENQNKSNMLGELISVFGTRQGREITGLLLED